MSFFYSKFSGVGGKGAGGGGKEEDFIKSKIYHYSRRNMKNTLTSKMTTKLSTIP